MNNRHSGACGYVAVFVLFAVCTSVHAAQFVFAVFGDTPYNAAEELLFPGLMAEMEREPLAFAIHVGDFKSPAAACSDALYLKRREAFDRSRHPFVYLPGDNDWLDCRRPRGPLESLARLRELFFQGDTTLGQRRLAVERQTKRGYPEHMRWIVDGVVFATLNIPGHTNNAGAPESPPRTAAALDWMRDAFRIGRERRLPAIVVVLHADLWIGHGAYATILAALAEESLRYSGEVLVVHGDTHWHRFDQPLVDPRSGKRVANVTRLEVVGSPLVGWTHVSVGMQDGKVRFTATSGGDISRR